ncbi:MAG: glycogen synthase GlgA [Candidatus Acidiferrales bacterium]
MKILFAASEGLPYSKTGGLADVIEALPKALVALGHEVSVILPRYRKNPTEPVVLPSLTVEFGERMRFPSIVGGEARDGVRYFFVDDPEYFDREQLYVADGKDYPDNAERFGEYARSVVEFAKRSGPFDAIHCHDWQTGLVPVLMRTQYENDPVLSGVPVVFTIHNMGYHGSFPRDVLARLGLPDSLFNIQALEFYGQVNFLKGGLEFSDYLTTVSRKYAQEIQTVEYGCGLDGVIRGRADRLQGILNGVDYSIWSPEQDGLIAAKYSAKDLGGKRACKKDLLGAFGLPASRDVDLNRPLVGIVSRFATQKGFDLVEEIAPDLMRLDLAIAALGAGEARYEKLFRDLAARFPHKVAVMVAYDNTIAHKIEAGSDMFLMPSRYEPCGLNQIYSLRYGTVPIVRATGGLDDTIEPFSMTTGKGTGFKFSAYDGKALLDSVREALAVFAGGKAWRELQLNGMAKDFSWKASAGEYARLYEVAWKSRNRKPTATSN